MRLRFLPVLVGTAVLFNLLLLGSLVYAQDEAPAAAVPVVAAPAVNAATRVAELAFQLLVPIVTAIGAWLAHRLVKLVESKAKVDIPEREEKMIDHWVDQAIHFAAEKSYRKMKSTTMKLTGPEKLEEAARFALDQVEARGLVAWTKDKIEKKIEAKLGTMRSMNDLPTADSDVGAPKPPAPTPPPLPKVA